MYHIKPENTFIFAASPSANLVTDKEHYIRPIVTIEPTAIKYGLVPNMNYGTYDNKEFSHELINDKFNNKTIIVAWEHHALIELANNLYTSAGLENNPNIPSSWNSADFDTIYDFRIIKDNNKITNIIFTTRAENLNEISNICSN